MGFSYNDITSKSMGLKARLTSWQVSGRLRNFTTTVPGKYGVTDFGAGDRGFLQHLPKAQLSRPGFHAG